MTSRAPAQAPMERLSWVVQSSELTLLPTLVLCDGQHELTLPFLVATQDITWGLRSPLFMTVYTNNSPLFSLICAMSSHPHSPPILPAKKLLTGGET
jgi:hypothetical protein